MLWHDPSYDATPLWKDVKLNTLGSEIIWNKLFTDYEVPDIKHTDIPVLLYSGVMITSTHRTFGKIIEQNLKT